LENDFEGRIWWKEIVTEEEFGGSLGWAGSGVGRWVGVRKKLWGIGKTMVRLIVNRLSQLICLCFVW